MNFMDFLLQRNPKLDSGFSWYIAICGCLYHILVVGFHLTSGVLFVLIQDRYGISKELASYPINTLASIQMICAVSSGPILHRIKARKTLMLGALLGIIGSCLSICSPFEDTIAWLSFCMGIRGIGASIGGPATMQIVTSHFKRHRAKAFTVIFLFYPLGGLILPSTVRRAAEEYGLQASWLIHASIYCQALLFAMLIQPRKIVQENPTNREADETELETFLENGEEVTVKRRKEIAKPKQESLAKIMSSLFRDKTFYVLVVAQIILNCTNMAFRTTIVDYGRDIDLEVNMNKFILEILSVADIARIIAALIVDARLCHEETILTFSCFTSAITLGLLTLTTKVPFVAVAFCYSLLFAASSSCHVPLFATLGVTRLAVSFGISFSVNGVFQLGLPVLIGLFRDVYGTYDYLFYLFSLLNALLAFVFCYSWKRNWFDHKI